MRTKEWDGYRSPKERAGTLPNSSLPPPPEPGSDEALLARALLHRDEAVFDGLLDRLHSPMLRLARVFVRSREDAEEVVQDTWLAALSGIDRFQGRSSLRTWLFRILVYRARTRGKREARMVPFSALAGPGERRDELREDSQLGDLPRPGTDLFLSEAIHRTRTGPEEELLSAELRARVEAAIQELPARQQEVITLRDVEGWTVEEVCELLGVSLANQRVLLHRARVRVRDALRPYMESTESADVSHPMRCVRVSDRPPQRPPVRPGGHRGRRGSGRPSLTWTLRCPARSRFLCGRAAVEGVQQGALPPGRHGLLRQRREMVDGPADLAQVALAARAGPQVLPELASDPRRQRALQVLGEPEPYRLASA